MKYRTCYIFHNADNAENFLASVYGRLPSSAVYGNISKIDSRFVDITCLDSDSLNICDALALEALKREHPFHKQKHKVNTMNINPEQCHATMNPGVYLVRCKMGEIQAIDNEFKNILAYYPFEWCDDAQANVPTGSNFATIKEANQAIQGGNY
jgi:hypothetical protein